jgi:hypothetical protein
LSAAIKAKWADPEFREKALGGIRSEEHRNKISDAIR